METFATSTAAIAIKIFSTVSEVITTIATAFLAIFTWKLAGATKHLVADSPVGNQQLRVSAPTVPIESLVLKNL